jgi:hypothetical protein
MQRGYRIDLRDTAGLPVPLRDGQLDLQMNEFRLLILTRSKH